MVQISADAVQRLRLLSKLVFGQELRLALILAIGREKIDTFPQADLVVWVNARSFSVIERPFDSLRRSGAVTKVETTGTTANTWRRENSRIWAYGEELLSTAMTMPEPDQLF